MFKDYNDLVAETTYVSSRIVFFSLIWMLLTFWILFDCSEHGARSPHKRWSYPTMQLWEVYLVSRWECRSNKSDLQYGGSEVHEHRLIKCWPVTTICPSQCEGQGHPDSLWRWHLSGEKHYLKIDNYRMALHHLPKGQLWSNLGWENPYRSLQGWMVKESQTESDGNRWGRSARSAH